MPADVAARTCLAVVLAAGEGTRMKSARPKVLHRVAGRSMLGHVLTAVAAAGARRIAVVIGPDRDDVAKEAGATACRGRDLRAGERLGTAHAVLSARDGPGAPGRRYPRRFRRHAAGHGRDLRRLRAPLAGGAAVAVLGFEARIRPAMAALILRNGQLGGIREHKDATARSGQSPSAMAA